MVIETERLTLSEFTAEDAAFILGILNSPGWLEYIGDRGVRTLEQARDYLLYGPMGSYKTSGFGFYCVRLKENNASIGMCGLVKRKELEDTDIGFAFLPAFENKGYAYEAAAATLAYAKNTLKIKRLAAITQENNASCIKLLDKLGLTYGRKIIFPANEELLLYAIEL